MLELVRAFHDAGKTIAAVCHAPWVLIEAGIAKGREMTCYHSVKTDLKNAGAHYVDREAVAEMLAHPDDDPTDLAALDAVWEETEVTFGPDPNAGCPQVRDMLAAMDRPIPKNLNRSA